MTKARAGILAVLAALAFAACGIEVEAEMGDAEAERMLALAESCQTLVDEAAKPIALEACASIPGGGYRHAGTTWRSEWCCGWYENGIFKPYDNRCNEPTYAVRVAVAAEFLRFVRGHVSECAEPVLMDNPNPLGCAVRACLDYEYGARVMPDCSTGEGCDRFE